MEEREYWFWLHAAFVQEPRKGLELAGLYGGPEALYREENPPLSPTAGGTFKESRDRLAALLAERDALEKQGMHWCCLKDEVYPERLRVIPDPPIGLFYKGKLPPEDRPSVGIVGARNCSPYGRSMAERFGEDLAADGISVISGMALGVDGHAQGAAVRAGGASFAVLGCGADLAYPALNRGLYENLTEKGGIISEYFPGTPPLPHQFPVRNRLISGLSDVLLVLEAREKSGSLITADQALEQGKDVLALPGRIDEELSAGCNRLIRQGAGILTCLSDVYEALHLPNPRGLKEETGGQPLSRQEETVLKLLSSVPVHREELLTVSGLGFGELALLLLGLEERGLVRAVSSDRYVKR